MKLININYGIDIEFSENETPELVIEHPSIFATVVSSLLNQCNGADGDFVLSDNEQIIKLNKSADVLVDYFTLSTNNKKIITKLYSGLEEVAEQFIEENAEINSRIVSLLDSITTSNGCADIIYNLDFNWSDIFKIYNISFVEDYTGFLDKLSSYIRIVSKYTDIRTLFLINIRAYMTEDDLISLYEIARYCKVSLILVEPRESIERNGEKRYIIDKDQCFIDAN
ncbi:MAG: type II-A CRISPR-associated protein Csn2 [Eubacterium sp.]|nr:type II-A CRISPR-associated protein Csn2 [Eubacterium sp.]